MPKPFADASQWDTLVEATDNVGPEDYPDPPQDPLLEDESEPVGEVAG